MVNPSTDEELTANRTNKVVGTIAIFRVDSLGMLIMLMSAW